MNKYLKAWETWLRQAEAGKAEEGEDALRESLADLVSRSKKEEPRDLPGSPNPVDLSGNWWT